jgi:hypothetical protein
MATVTGGDKIAVVLGDLGKKLANAQVVRVGFLEGAKYPDGKPVAMIAAINEFGAPSRGQPPRPFFRRMIASHKGEWPDAIKGLLKANDYDAERTLDQAGAAVAGQLRQSITDLVDPPLAPSTIRAKGFDKPLIHHSIMLNSVDHEVKKRG